MNHAVLVLFSCYSVPCVYPNSQFLYYSILKPPSAPKMNVDGTSSSMLPPADCIGRRRPPIGEKCFALLMVFLVGGIVIFTLGATCIIPVRHLRLLNRSI